MHSTGIPIEKILESARRAPSGDNIQPWRFLWDGERTLKLYSSLPSDAPERYPYFHTGAFVNLGIMLEFIAIAARHYGYEAAAERHPAFSIDADSPFATIRFWPDTRAADPNTEGLFAAIPLRSTSRLPFLTKPLDGAAKTRLVTEANAAGSVLAWVEGRETLGTFADALAEQDKLFWNHPELRGGLVLNIKTDAEVQREGAGIPLSALGVGIFRHTILPSFFLARAFPLLWKISAFQAERATRRSIMNSAALGFMFVPQRPRARVLEPEWDSAPYLAGGRSIARVWLAATAEGLAFQPVYAFVAMTSNAGNERIGGSFPTVSERVLDLLRATFPESESQTLVFAFRVGYPKEGTLVPQAPKKSLATMLKVAP